MTGTVAEELVKDGRADWVEEPWEDSNGKQHKTRRPAIKLRGKKRWAVRMSDAKSPRRVRTWQLVGN
jgi:hypothetical protein